MNAQTSKIVESFPRGILVAESFIRGMWSLYYQWNDGSTVIPLGHYIEGQGGSYVVRFEVSNPESRITFGANVSFDTWKGAAFNHYAVWLNG